MPLRTSINEVTPASYTVTSDAAATLKNELRLKQELCPFYQASTYCLAQCHFG